MKVQMKSVVLGFGLACLLLVGILAAFLFVARNDRPIFRDQLLASGKTVQINSFHFVWGVEHDERRKRDDSFALEYVSSVAHEDLAGLDRETLEVFELIRPVSEQWGFQSATISVFPTVQRKGRYYIYTFSREPPGRWTYQRNSAKVYIDD